MLNFIKKLIRKIQNVIHTPSKWRGVYSLIGCLIGFLFGPLGGIIGLLLGYALAGIVAWYHKNKPRRPISSQETASRTTSSPAGARYVGNSHTLEIHDIEKLTPACMFELITEEHRQPFYTKAEMLNAIEKKGYNGCRWCLKEYDTG